MNWNFYHWKKFGYWTPTLAYLPRWQSFNSNATVLDPIPSDSVPFSFTSPSISTPSSGKIPVSFVLAVTVPSTSTPSQKLFSVITEELQQLTPTLLFLATKGIRNPDISEPYYIWTASATSKVSKVEIQLSDNSYVEMANAKSKLDLFQKGDWAWYQESGRLFIYGLDIIERTSSGSALNSWQYGPSNNFNEYGINYLQVTDANNFSPFLPTSLSVERGLPFYGGPIKIRTHLTSLSSSMVSVNIKIDGVNTVAVISNLRNGLDELGIWFRATRRYLESNIDFGARLFNHSKFFNPTYQGLRSLLSNYIGTGVYQLIDARKNTTLSFGSSSTGFSVDNRFNKIYTVDTAIVQPQPNQFRFSQSSFDYYLPEKDNLILKNTVFLNGKFYLPDYIYSKNLPTIYGISTIWTKTASSMTFTDNAFAEDDIPVFVTSKVDTSFPAIAELIKVYNQYSYALKWNSQSDEMRNSTGVGDFTC